MSLFAKLSIDYENDDQKRKVGFIAISLSLILMSTLILCLMPYNTADKTTDQLIERHIIQIIAITLLVIGPIGLLAVLVDHPGINSAILMFVVGIGCGCLCAITFSMFFLNIIFTLLDIIIGKFRLNAMEIIAINVLMIGLTIMLYTKTSLSRELYLLYLQNQKTVNTGENGGDASPETTGAVDYVQTIDANNGNTIHNFGKVTKSKNSATYYLN